MMETRLFPVKQYPAEPCELMSALPFVPEAG